LMDAGSLQTTVITTDGQPCWPHTAAGYWLAVGQRLDVVVAIPTEPGAYPVYAVVEGDSMDAHVLQSVLVIVVGGPEHIPANGAFSTTPSQAPGMLRGDFETSLRAWTPLPPASPTVTFALNLTGDNGFMSIDKRSWQLPPEAAVFVPNPHPLLVRTGDRVCILLRNFNADSHPFHLHGHHFEVTRVGERAFKGAMRDVVIVEPGECAEVEICFQATNPGVWPLHCHMSYHLAAGMLTTVEYTA